MSIGFTEGEQCTGARFGAGEIIDHRRGVAFPDEHPELQFALIDDAEVGSRPAFRRFPHLVRSISAHLVASEDVGDPIVGFEFHFGSNGAGFGLGAGCDREVECSPGDGEVLFELITGEEEGFAVCVQ